MSAVVSTLLDCGTVSMYMLDWTHTRWLKNASMVWTVNTEHYMYFFFSDKLNWIHNKWFCNRDTTQAHYRSFLANSVSCSTKTFRLHADQLNRSIEGEEKSKVLGFSAPEIRGKYFYQKLKLFQSRRKKFQNFSEIFKKKN